MGRGAADVVVVGAGVIGLSVAWRLSDKGAAVTVVDPSPAGGATRAAAGMLAPVTEAHYGEEELLSLNLASARAWPGFSAELEQASGEATGYDSSGTLSVGFDQSDKAVLDELHRFQESLGLSSTPLRPSACRRLEPTLAPSVSGGLDVPSDHQVDPRKVARALQIACEGSGVAFLADEVSEFVATRDGLQRLRTRSGELVVAGEVVLAAGWQSSSIPGLPAGALPPVRPVKGQVLRLRLSERLPRPARTIRALVRGQSVYVVSRGDGEIVCGATVEELGADTTVTAGAVYSLLRDAQAVLPLLFEAELVEATAGLRPGSPDNVPLIGESSVPHLLMATGHYRNGILLAPLTAEIVAGLAAGEAPCAKWSFVDPRRFEVPAGRTA